MRKKGFSLKENLIFLFVMIIILFLLLFFLIPKDKVIFKAPPTFHEFYGSVKCTNNQIIPNGHSLIGIIASNQYTTQINNGEYQLFVQNGNNGQNIDFFVDFEPIQDEIFQSFRLTEKNILLNNAYCTIEPAILTNIPDENQVFNQANIEVTFSNFNFVIGSRGERHLHIYLDSDITPYMFYNGISNQVEYNGAIASNILRLNSNSFRIINLVNGNHQIRLSLAESSHSELTNPESTHEISFSINVQSVPSDGGGGGGSGGGGGGGGGSKSSQCNDNKDNDKDTKKDYPNDPGCISKQDDSEIDPIQITYKCSDKIDNDRDTLIDLEDPGCINLLDNSEDNSNIFTPELPVLPEDDATVSGDNINNKKMVYIVFGIILALAIISYIIIKRIMIRNKQNY